jgi:type III pantothenate kinase
MLLAVDIGNTSTKFGIFDGERLSSKFSISTDPNSTIDELKFLVGQNIHESISEAIVCSVVPGMDASMRELLIDVGIADPVFVSNSFDFGLKINYQPLSSLGTDRLVNSFAAAEKYRVPCIVCSFGTATTVDVVDQNRELLGGIIAPGMETMVKALNMNTAKLPEIKIEKPKSIVGNSTVTSIQSGIFYGQIAIAEGMVERMKKEIGGNPNVVATGGSASLIAENTNCIDLVDENLLLDGLRLLQERSYHQRLET